MLGNGEYNAIERELDQMTGFSNMFDRKDVKFTPINWGEVRSSGAGLQARKFWDTN